MKIIRTVTVEKKPGCVAFTTEILGNKWTPLIVMELCEKNLRFNELLAAIKVNPRTLSARLDCLETAEIITRTVHAQTPPRVEYALTAKGRDLVPILRSMAKWGEKYAPSMSN